MGYCSTFQGEIRADKDVTLDAQKKVTYSVYGWKKADGYQPGDVDSYLWSVFDGGIMSPEESTKYYDYEEDLIVMVKTFADLGYTLNGEVMVTGEEPGDHTKLVVINNEVEAKPGRIVFD